MNLPPPRDWPAFERLARDLIGRIFGDVHADLHGRSGQAQAGIDILAVDRISGALVGVQCKGRGSGERHRARKLSEQDVREEVRKAEGYSGRLDRFVILTTGQNSARLKSLATALTAANQLEGKFEVIIHGWDWIEGHLAHHVDLAIKHGLAVSVPQNHAPPSLISQEIGSRLRRAIKLMNEGRSTEDHFTLPSLAAHLGQDDWRWLERVATGHANVGTLELRSIADAFGFDAAWLIEGKNAPFRLDPADTYVTIEQLFEQLLAMNPRGVYFVRADGEDFDATVVVERDDVRWFVWRTDFPVSKSVGATGRRQMLDFCGLIRRFCAKQSSHEARLAGRHLSHADFQALLEGQIYPGRFLRRCRNDHWWEDFASLKAEDVSGNRPCDIELRQAVEIAALELDRVRDSCLQSQWAADYLQWGYLLKAKSLPERFRG